MSPKSRATAPARVGRPPTPRDQILAAADDLFQEGAEGPAGVTMDAVAAGAGVGKGTVFRAFGDRDGLLDALSASKFEPLRRSVEAGSGAFAADRPPAERLLAFLDGLLAFKIDNANLMRAREAAGGGDLSSDRYLWTHDLLQGLLREAAPELKAKDADYTAQTLLAAVRSDLLDALLAGGHSKTAIRRAQRRQVTAIIEGPGRARRRG